MAQNKILFGGAIVLFCGAAQTIGACGGDGGRPDNLPATGGGGSGGSDSGDYDSSSGGAGFGGFGAKDGSTESGTGATGGSSVGAPIVTVTSPAAAADPVADIVVVGDQLSALCTAEAATVAGAKPVDPSSVKIAVLNSANSVVDEFPGQPTTTSGEYGASFVLSTIVNGPFSVRCTASDTSTPPKTGSDTLKTFVDHGPNISVTTPAVGSAYPLIGAVPFVFKVSPAPLAATDPEAAVASVTLNANGVDIPATPDPGVTDGYKVAVNFADTTLFPQAPNGSVPVVIKGTNSRTPDAVEKTHSYSFVVDGAGPVIIIKTPKNQDIIGGQVTLSFSVVDSGSGVNKSTVAVELNQVQTLFGPTVQWTNNNDDYTFTFDSANVAGSKVQVTVNITASDVVGNDSAGTSVVLYLDNKGPIVDLDSANVRTTKKSGTTETCSSSFDPLGSLAANDLQDYITPFKHFRTLVWEQTNFIAGQTVLYYAKTDPTSVYLYLQADGPTVPLLVNNDTDLECDALNTVVNGVTLPNLKLNPVNPAGNAWYKDDGASTPPPIPATCGLGAESTPPPYLCTNQSDLSVVIRHTMSGVEPVVYGIGAMTGLECTGTGWELSSQLANATQKEGWFCLAATAKDKVGNTSISRPLRVCYDDPATSFTPGCANSSIAAPSCTDGCTPPAGFPATVLPAP